MLQFYVMQDGAGWEITAYGEDERRNWEREGYYVTAQCDATPKHGLISFGNNLLGSMEAKDEDY